MDRPELGEVIPARPASGGRRGAAWRACRHRGHLLLPLAGEEDDREEAGPGEIVVTSPSPSKDKFFEKVINPYPLEVMKHPQSIEMHEGVLHFWDVKGPKKEGSEKARLAVVEQEIFKFQGMVEHGLSANHSMITDFIRENKLDTRNMGQLLSKLQDQIDHLQDQIYELHGQNYEYESSFQRTSLLVDFGVPETKHSLFDGKRMEDIPTTPPPSRKEDV
ncbi:hypothetical protein ZWY2020_049612 [Hordeum vulgare]|nr:hypothetical protein ZWY2020_049612 [Hordeum vulgare]